MKLKDCREAYYNNSGKLSDIVRYLAFAGITLIWSLRGGVLIPIAMKLPFFLLIAPHNKGKTLCQTIYLPLVFSLVLPDSLSTTLIIALAISRINPIPIIPARRFRKNPKSNTVPAMPANKTITQIRTPLSFVFKK